MNIFSNAPTIGISGAYPNGIVVSRSKNNSAVAPNWEFENFPLALDYFDAKQTKIKFDNNFVIEQNNNNSKLQ